MSPNKEVNAYQSTQIFLKNIHHYPKQTKIMLGQLFDDFEPKGLEIAAYLHGLGFTHLYLCTAQNFSGHQIPDYLTIIMKPDVGDDFKRIFMG